MNFTEGFDLFVVVLFLLIVLLGPITSLSELLKNRNKDR